MSSQSKRKPARQLAEIRGILDRTMRVIHRDFCGVFTVYFGAPLVRTGPGRTIEVRVPRNWVAAVVKSNLLVFDSRVTLDANRLRKPEGADAAWLIQQMWLEGYRTWHTKLAYAVEVAGVICTGCDIAEAYERCLHVFERALGVEGGR